MTINRKRAVKLHGEAETLTLARTEPDVRPCPIRVWEEMMRDNPRQVDINKMTGHHQFGPNHVPLNVGNDAIVEEICRCRDDGRIVRARALQWAAGYGFVVEQLKSDPELARSICVVRYEDLCTDAEQTIDRILAHTGLSQEAFSPMRADYVAKLSLPDYYRPNFSPEERAEIIALTRDAAKYFGYDLMANEAAAG